MASIRKKISHLNLPSLSSLNLGGRSSAKEKKRDAYLEGLYELWERVSTVETPRLDPDSFNEFRIVCVNLLHEPFTIEASNTPSFFRRMPQEKLHEYQIDMDDQETALDVSDEKDLWSLNRQVLRELDPVGLAASIATAIRIAFNSHERKTSDGKQVTLKQISGWKKADFGRGIFHDAFDDDILHSKHWYPEDAWESVKPEDQPHVMLTLAHEYEVKDDSLLRGEVLAIVATMVTRLESESFKHHSIIPVMVLSFTAERKGRILQAYFADNGLVVYKSRLFSFNESEGATSAEFFLRFERKCFPDRPDVLVCAKDTSE
ncbi:hypothetical protein CFD26_106919 [Aspergillus turcosus]|uniref:Uncharacterized protein n=1 Tax=Aspergillus turcosus TaxID=1245748 RepID=A0A421D531_9EURO|nr:hypothetical protein CFD26_106919 [Aspergillus turcosus]